MEKEKYRSWKSRIRTGIVAVFLLVGLFPVDSFAWATDHVYCWPVSTSTPVTCGWYYSSGALHGGTDFGCAVGSPVYAVADGTVSLALDSGCLGAHRSGANGPICSKGSSCAALKLGSYGSYANYINILHGNGINSIYGHLTTGRLQVKTGDIVKKGQLIGYSGNAGNSSGPHLHFEMRKNNDYNQRVNPQNYLTKENVTPGSTAAPDKLTVYPLPFKAFNLANNNTSTNAYNDPYGNSYLGHVYATDECVISEVYSNGMCKLTCPWENYSNGRVVYCQLSEFLIGTGNPTSLVWSGSRTYTYKRASDSSAQSSWWIDTGDAIKIIGTSGNKTQVIYPTSGGYYRCAWVLSSSVSSGESSSLTVDNRYPSGNISATTISRDKTPVYSSPSTSSATGRNIYGRNISPYVDDVCIIDKIYTNGWCHLTYPDGTTSKEAYVPFSAFVPNQKYNVTRQYIGDKVTVYHRSDLKESFGSVWEENVYVVSAENGNYQIMYPLSSGGYKLGWVSGSTITTKFTITYNANGGSGAPSAQTKTMGTALTLSTSVPDRTGYTFLGWSANSGATSATYGAGDLFYTDADTTLYAVWRVNHYQIKYDGNGGDGVPDTQTKYYGTTLTLSSIIPSRNGFTFLGWGTSYDAEQATYQAGASFNEEKDVILYAVWEANQCTLSYDLNGGTGQIKNQIIDALSETKVSGVIPERENYTFQGWSLDKDGTFVDYQPEEEITIDQNLTLYAVWKEVVIQPPIEIEREGQIIHQTIRGGVDQTVSLTIRLKSSAKIRYISFSLGGTITENFELESISNGNIFTTAKLDESTKIWYSDADVEANGELATLTYKIDKEIAGADYFLELNNIQCLDADENEVEVSLSDIYIRNHKLYLSNVICEPDCSNTGIETWTCSYAGCDGKRTDVIPIDSDSHTGNTELRNQKAATEDDEGYSGDIYCKDCQKLLIQGEVIPAGSHEYVSEVYAPSCTEPGYTLMICKTCGESYKTEYIFKEHEWETEKTIDVEPGCTTTGIKSIHCAACGATKEQEIIKKTGHHFTVIAEQVNPTCTKEGTRQKLACSGCDIVLGGASIPVIDHLWKEEKSIDSYPTCTEEGSKSIHCVNCDATKDVETIPKNEHIPVIDEAVEATCVKQGLTEGSHCDVCNTVLVEQQSVPSTDNHDWETEKRIDKKANCQREGSMSIHCKNCDTTKEVETIPKEDHEIVMDEAVEATCTHYGLTAGKHCQVCEEVFEPQQFLPEKAHTAVIDEAVKATCLKEGLTTGCHCTVCGEIIVAQESIPKEEHQLEIDEAVKPDCAHTGLTAGIHCSTCNTVFKAQERIAKTTEHTWDEGKVTKEPTYTSKGEKTYTCLICKTATKTESIDSLKQEEQPAESEKTTTQPVTTTAQSETTTADPVKAAQEREKRILAYAVKNKISRYVIQTTDSSIRKQKSEDIKGASYYVLSARMAKASDNAISLQWNKVKGADGYIIYGNQCNKGSKKYQFKKIAQLRSNKTSYAQKKLKKGTFYKYLVIAYKKLEGRNVTIAASKTIHVITTGSKYENSKAIKVNKGKVTVKKNKSYQIKASEVIKNGKKIYRHRKIAYESSNPSIASVSTKGLVKGKKKGSCIIYVYAQNGICQRVKITVK